MLPARCRGGRALLRLTGLVEDQDPAVGAEVPGQERAHRSARSVLVPAGAIEQVVQAVGPIQADWSLPISCPQDVAGSNVISVHHLVSVRDLK